VTRSARRRVFVGVFVLILTVPAESILLRALAAPDQATAAQQWTANLAPDDLIAAGSRVQAYPFVYRRAIMAALSPQVRSWIWRGHLLRYVQLHPELDASAVALIQQAAKLATPEVLSGVQGGSAEIRDVAAQMQVALGRDVVDSLLYRLGPKDTQVGSAALPVRERLANFARQQFLVLAGGNGDCSCSTSWGCDDGRCGDGAGCTVVDTWPMCGLLWLDECDGACKTGSVG